MISHIYPCRWLGTVLPWNPAMRRCEQFILPHFCRICFRMFCIDCSASVANGCVYCQKTTLLLPLSTGLFDGDNCPQNSFVQLKCGHHDISKLGVIELPCNLNGYFQIVHRHFSKNLVHRQSPSSLLLCLCAWRFVYLYFAVLKQVYLFALQSVMVGYAMFMCMLDPSQLVASGGISGYGHDCYGRSLSHALHHHDLMPIVSIQEFSNEGIIKPAWMHCNKVLLRISRVSRFGCVKDTRHEFAHASKENCMRYVKQIKIRCTESLELSTFRQKKKLSVTLFQNA